jgi:hypothetical protein
VLHVTWKKGTHVADLTADLDKLSATIMHTPYAGSEQDAVRPGVTAAAAAGGGVHTGVHVGPGVDVPSIGGGSNSNSSSREGWAGVTPVTSLDWREIVGAGDDGSVTRTSDVSDTAATDVGEEEGEVEMVELRLWPPVGVEAATVAV